MKTRTAILMFALLSGAAGASLADVHVYVNCKAKDGNCPPPPVPPVPPHPPAPPVPPAPPPAPEIPPVPDSAHADCAGKKPGTRLSFTLQPGETMSGVCQKQGGRMAFSLREYERKD
jgi:hypothetical protein